MTSIGIWGAVILTVLRFIQGIGVGGEWGGSVLLAMEWAQQPRPPRPGRLLAAIRRAGGPVPGQPGGAGCSAPVGRRVPDLGLAHSLRCSASSWSASACGSAWASWKRRSSAAAWRDKRIEKAPMLEVIRRQPREIILSALLRMSEQAPFYIFTAFIFAYARRHAAGVAQICCWPRCWSRLVPGLLHRAVVRPSLRPHRPAQDVS